MSEAIHRTTDMESQPRLMALLVLGLLYKLAGQQTVTIEELNRYDKEYVGIRINLNQETKQITLTLHPREAA